MFESGIPRAIPMYFVAYCWNRSPSIQQKPPRNSQKSTGRAVARSASTRSGPPSNTSASAMAVANSPTVKMEIKERGFTGLAHDQLAADQMAAAMSLMDVLIGRSAWRFVRKRVHSTHAIAVCGCRYRSRANVTRPSPRRVLADICVESLQVYPRVIAHVAPHLWHAHACKPFTTAASFVLTPDSPRAERV